MFERIESDPQGSGFCRGTIDGASPQGRFEVLDQGAQLISWAPPGAEPVIFCSSRAVRSQGVALRGGIPLCFPWFGTGPRKDRRPSHGFARITPWRLVRADASGPRTTLVWQLSEQDLTERPSGTPESFVVELQQTIGEELIMDLRVHNTSERSFFTAETALHSYFRVSDVREVTVEGLGGSEFLDQTTGTDHTQVGPVHFTDEVDRVYQSRARTMIIDPGMNRRIMIDKSGSASTVVWNPGEHKAAELADLGADQYRDFVCVETGNVGADAIPLHPGEQHQLRLRISVSELGEAAADK